MSTILLNNTTANINIIETFLNSLSNLGMNHNSTKLYYLNMSMDSSNNYFVEGTLIVTENNQQISYKKKQQFNYTSAIITDNIIIQNFNYIINNLTIQIDSIQILYNSNTYTCNSYFQVNNNKYYILNFV
jgi:hypothetical protein